MTAPKIPKEVLDKADEVASEISSLLEQLPGEMNIFDVIIGLATLSAGLWQTKVALLGTQLGSKREEQIREGMWRELAHAMYHAASFAIQREGVKQSDEKADKELSSDQLPIDAELEKILAAAMKENE